MNPFLDQPNPFVFFDPAALRADALRRMGQNPNAPVGPPSNTGPTGQGGPLSDVYRELADEYMLQGQQKLNAPVDPSAYVELMKRNQSGARRKLAIALAAMEAGDQYKGLGGEYLKKSLSLQDPLRVGNAGLVDASGTYVEDPTFANQQRANFLLQQAQRYDQLAQRAASAEDRAAAQKAAADALAESRRAAAEARGQTNSLQSLILEERLQKERDKREERERVMKMRLANAESNFEIVVDNIKKAKKVIGPLSAGYGGLFAVLPESEARKLATFLDPIKAILGFDKLRQMREESESGGALGQIAVQELKYLQSSVASLDQWQKPKDLLDALNKIEYHYRKWLSHYRDIYKKPESSGPPQGAVRPRGAPTAPAAGFGAPPPGAVRPRGAPAAPRAPDTDW